MQPDAGNPSDGRPRRVIKRYSNRKLYDTRDSRYVTLLQIAEIMRAGEDVQIIDNATKEDLTEVTLAQIIYEEQKAKSRNLPLQTLKELIHQQTEKVWSELREGPIGRLIPSPKVEASPPPKPPAEASKTAPRLVDQAKGAWEDWQNKIDEQIRLFMPNFTPWQQLQSEVKRLTKRVEELEKKAGQASGATPQNNGSGNGKRPQAGNNP